MYYFAIVDSDSNVEITYHENINDAIEQLGYYLSENAINGSYDIEVGFYNKYESIQYVPFSEYSIRTIF